MQNEVIEKKEKKPLSKKRIVAIVALSLVAVLILVPVVNQCVIALLDGEAYEQDGRRLNTHIYAENVYVEGGVIHYTIVNNTLKELKPRAGYSPLTGETHLEQYVDGKWVKCEPSGQPPLGYKGYNQYDTDTDASSITTVPAFGELELAYDYEYQTFELKEGEYRFWAAVSPSYSAITQVFKNFHSSASARVPKSYKVPVYFSIPAAP